MLSSYRVRRTRAAARRRTWTHASTAAWAAASRRRRISTPAAGTIILLWGRTIYASVCRRSADRIWTIDVAVRFYCRRSCFSALGRRGVSVLAPICGYGRSVWRIIDWFGASSNGFGCSGRALHWFCKRFWNIGLIVCARDCRLSCTRSGHWACRRCISVQCNIAFWQSVRRTCSETSR